MTQNCYDLYGDYFNKIDEQNELSNYTWYHDKNNADKIGINSDGSLLIHDNMIYKLKKFKIDTKQIKNINSKQLIFKLSNRQNTEDNQNNQNNNNLQKEIIFTDLIFSEKSNYVIFIYLENNKSVFSFSHIIFNGKKFMSTLNK